jgi:hypothetical protein
LRVRACCCELMTFVLQRRVVLVEAVHRMID